MEGRKPPQRSKAINNFGDETNPVTDVAIIVLIPLFNAVNQPARSRRCVQADVATRCLDSARCGPRHGIDIVRCPGARIARSIPRTESGPVAGTAIDRVRIESRRT